MAALINIEATVSNPRTWLGYQRMMDAILKGEILSDVLMGLLRCTPKGEAPNLDMFNGALQCLLDSWSSMVLAGVGVTNEKKAIQSFLNGSKARMVCDLVQAEISGIEALKELILNLCDCVERTGTSIRFTVAKPTPATEKALPVRLVASPERVITTTVQRDDNLEIVSTTTRETDAP